MISSTIRAGEEPCPSTTDRTGTIIILAFLASTVLAHWLAGNGYGFQRDELQTLDDARHLAWGYVAYPSLTPLFGRLSLTLFGTSLRGFRFFASLALAAVLVMFGLTARQLGAPAAPSCLQFLPCCRLQLARECSCSMLPSTICVGY